MPATPAFARIGPPWWDDRPVAIVAAGPSLIGADLARLSGRARVLAINSSMFDLPFADAGFGIDTNDLADWWPRFGAVGYPVWWALPDRWRLPDGDIPANLAFVRRMGGAQVSDDPGTIHSGGTSGFAALAGFARLKRARRVVLFGYDYRPDEAGRFHWNEHQIRPGLKYTADGYRRWATCFDQVAARLRHDGMSVVNASPDSLVSAFPRVSIEDGLRLIEGTARWPRSPRDTF